MKLPYTEGSVFFVPLKDGTYARGVVTRSSKRGKVLFGYFFGPKLHSTEHASMSDLTPSKAISILEYGDLGLINGEWKICGKLPDWNRDEWPIPLYVRKSDLSKKAWIVQYSDLDPLQVVKETRTDYDSDLPPASLYGYGAVEIHLSKRLS